LIKCSECAHSNSARCPTSARRIPFSTQESKRLQVETPQEQQRHVRLWHLWQRSKKQLAATILPTRAFEDPRFELSSSCLASPIDLKQVPVDYGSPSSAWLASRSLLSVPEALAEPSSGPTWPVSSVLLSLEPWGFADSRPGVD